MKNTDKITLTIGQLKRLIKESKFNKSDEAYWEIFEMKRDPYFANRWISNGVIQKSPITFFDINNAYVDGLKQLKKYSNGDYEMRVYNKYYVVFFTVENHDGKIKEIHWGDWLKD